MRNKPIRYFIILSIFAFVGFWSAQKYFESIFNTPVAHYIKTHTSRGEYIFSFPYDPLFYFRTARKSLFYLESFIPGGLSYKRQSKIIADIKRKNIRYLIFRGYNWDCFKDSGLDKYLQDNFFVQAVFNNFVILRKKGDSRLSPYVHEYEKLLSRFQEVNLLNNGDFEDILEGNPPQEVRAWGRSDLVIGINKKSPKSGTSALTLLPNSLNQYLDQQVKLPEEPRGEDVTFGVWAKGPEAPAFIRLRISTSIGHFVERYNISSTWMFYTVKGKLSKGDRNIGVYIFPDDGIYGESVFPVDIDGALLVYGDILL